MSTQALPSKSFRPVDSSLSRLFAELFAATPLAIVLKAFAAKR